MNDREFLDFWKTVEWPTVVSVHFRLYHDDLGRALFYSHEDVPGKYIDITAEQFAAQDLQVTVVGKTLIPRPKPTAPKLVPGSQGIACDPNDVCIVVSPQQPNQRWKLKQNESD